MSMTILDLRALIDDPDKTWRDVLHALMDLGVAALRTDLDALREKVDALEGWRAAQAAADAPPPDAAGSTKKRGAQ